MTTVCAFLHRILIHSTNLERTSGGYNDVRIYFAFIMEEKIINCYYHYLNWLVFGSRSRLYWPEYNQQKFQTQDAAVSYKIHALALPNNLLKLEATANKLTLENTAIYDTALAEFNDSRIVLKTAAKRIDNAEANNYSTQLAGLAKQSMQPVVLVKSLIILTSNPNA